MLNCTLTSSRECTLELPTTSMADGGEDIFLFGDDFDAILDLLEQDEDMEEHFKASVENNQPEIIVCFDCGKQYKTRGGFQRHSTTKHSNIATPKEQLITLTPSILSDIVETAVQKVKTFQLYAQSFKNEMEVYSFEELEEDTVEFAKLKSIFDGYSKNGDTEKFYAKYYAEIPLNSGKYFKGLSRNASTLLSTKVADCMLVYCKQLKTSKDTSLHLQTVLSDRETAGLQYLGGYVLHNLYKKHGTKKSPESQQAMSILKAGKLDDGCNSQKLVSNLFSIFFRTEHHFRQLSPDGNLQSVNTKGITDKSVTDSELLAYYNLMVSDSELVSATHVIKDVLHAIVHLYVRVRSFSLAKDIIQHHKLRKEISRNCEEGNRNRLE
ncbi:uncharacterized protein LOC122960870 isoform X2 [Acropora millepora]|uniref:uncharacterized protein LOC122960870 isoform X2 n=1 Tax=Acropora millepora TaxID=45264 RepID=UPI001CF4EDEB|nr:uncharacterized protein LOC122960870 isoform X2 [Acropora millepora]